MIAIDTNVLVRLLVGDDETQAHAAERLVTQARRDATSLFVADVVLCELVWVLRSQLKLKRAEIVATLDRLLATELIVVGDAGVVQRALDGYRDGQGDFADYMIREQALANDAREVVTFDRALKREDGFRMLG